MNVYYAHCIALYGTPQEDRDVAMLEQLGFDVLNPNFGPIQEQVDAVKHDFAALRGGQPDGHLTLERRAVLMPFREVGEAIMTLVFQPLASGADALAFRALPDGRIPSGVALEITWARDAGKPVFELPANLGQRVMSLGATREYLLEIGAR